MRKSSRLTLEMWRWYVIRVMIYDPSLLLIKVKLF